MEKGNLMLFLKQTCIFSAPFLHVKPIYQDSQFLMDKINYNPIIFLFLLSNVQKKKDQNGLKIAMHIWKVRQKKID